MQPQRTRTMHNDGLNFAVSTGGGLAAWVATFSMLIPLLWGMYVLILIAIKLPELYEKNQWFRAYCDWWMSKWKWLWKRLKGSGNGSKN